MDKIYSRKRFLIPRLRSRVRNKGRLQSNILRKIKSVHGKSYELKEHGGYNKNNGEDNFNKVMNRKLVKTFLVVVIAIFIANKIITGIEPTVDILCSDMAKSIATRITNEQATLVMRKL